MAGRLCTVERNPLFSLEDRTAVDKAESSFALDRIRLRFADHAFEQAFRREHARQSVRIIRMALVVGAVVYAVFATLDFLIAKEHYRTLWLIRFGIVIPAIIAIAFTYSQKFQNYGQLMLACAMVMAGAGVVAMTAILPPELSTIYYVGLILVLVYCSTLIRLSYPAVCAISLILVGSYEVVALAINPVAAAVLISNTYFLISSAIVAILIAYLSEYYIRANYRYTCMLLTEKARSEELMLEAQAASRAKTEFLANMSHELRTPLNAIIGFSEVMREEMFGPLGSKRYQIYAEDIFQSGSFLLQIIDDILNISKAEVGTLSLHETDFDLARMIDQCLRLFRDQAASAGLRLRLEAAPPDIVVHGDERLLRQALTNILSNALKFTQRGGAITIAVGRSPRTGIAISVADTGTGIAREEIEHVTQPFVQLENPYTREHAGTGLGLALAKRTMEWHNGQLRLESKPGVGTTVTLQLPPERVVVLDPPVRQGAGSG